MAALQEKLRTELPVTLHLGIRVASYDGSCLTLVAPLAANRNHKGNAFAGSLNAIATLGGWGIVWLALREHELDAHVVIQDSATRYLQPVTQDFEARACRPPADSMARLFHSVRRRGRGRVSVQATVSDANGRAVTFTGRFVVQRKEPGDATSDTPPVPL